MSKILVPANFDYTWNHWFLLHSDKIAVKRDIHGKIFVAVSIHIAIQTSKHLNFCSDMCSTVKSFPAFTHSHRAAGALKLFSEWFECQEHVSI